VAKFQAFRALFGFLRQKAGTKCISQNYILGTGKIRVFARRSPSKLVEAFARIFPVPFRNFGICTKKEGWLAPSRKRQDFDKGTHMEFALPQGF
jgi:hypothetical protein